MLGSLASLSYWRWAAHGKHPAAGDYFRVGDDLPLLRAFANWVHQGYQAFSSGRPTSGSGHRSWRFWAKGAARGQLVGGLLKDSTDSHGRPFPLLLMGTGPLTGWEQHWDLVPLACEGSWNQMERLGTRGFEALREFEAEIHKIRGPSAEWSLFKTNKDEVEKAVCSGGETNPPLQLDDLEKRAALFSRQSEISIPLTERASDDQFALISLWHSLLRARLDSVPVVVFMGGDQEAGLMILLQRPLRPDDFLQLWSGPGREGDKGW